MAHFAPRWTLRKNASRKLDIDRKEMMKAHSRLNGFIELELVPDDLKRSGQTR